MKALLVDQNLNVCWKYTFSLANALKKQNLDLIVVGDTICEQHNCSIDILRLFNTDVKGIGRYKKIINYYSSYKKILKYIKLNKINVVHFQWFSFSPLDYYFYKKIKKYCRIVLTVHDIKAFDSHFYDKIFYKKTYNLPDAIILQTPHNLELFKKTYPMISEDKIYFTYHGHFLEYANILDKKLACEKIEVDSKTFNFLFFGQLKKIKGVDVLLKAFGEFVKYNHNCKLIIAGSLWHNSFDDYEKIIKENKLDEFVSCHIKYIPDELVDYYFSASDVVCLPYTELFQSGVVQLAYAYKKPVISSNLDAFKEVINDNQTGFIFENKNDKDLCNKMLLAYKEKHRLNEMGEKGYKYIEDKFSWDKIAKRTYEIYKG